jgi:uncharacterized protein
MINTSLKTPGAYFESVKPTAEIETLRTDIAGFIGPTERGPVGQLTRVDGWRDFVNQFGGETLSYDMPFCVRGYFENGGEVAYIVRTSGGPFKPAAADWKVGELHAETHQWLPAGPAAGGFFASRYCIEATSPGVWGNGLRVEISYLQRGRSGAPQLTIKVVPSSGAGEFLPAVLPALLEQQVAEQSGLIRITAISGSAPSATLHQGPLGLSWGPIELKNGNEQPADSNRYLKDVEALLAEPEVALIVIPDLYRLPDPHHLLALVAARSDESLDRQVIIAPPRDELDVNQSVQWALLRREQLAARSARSVAVYQPWLDVRNPLGGVIEPLRRVPPVGHVAGCISRLDRERGAQYTPANTTLVDAVDASRAYDFFEQGVLVENGLNPLRCRQGRGLEVWGGRTLADPQADPEGLYLAHRRLIHRLVRAIRRVTAPLVFGNNGPQLWLVLVRAITTVLLQAFRAGALKGERPEESFRVTCDESNNPVSQQDLGQVICEIQLAPAVPMEFITLRIAISTEGRLELINS